MTKIFISYRRSDAADVTGRINDRLQQAFGKSAVFTDVDNIPLGVDFRKHLGEAVSQCEVLLAVVGREWLNEDNEARLNDPSDFVRIEIESALQREIPVIPLLVQGADIPSENHLPESLQELVYRNATKIRPDPDFHKDVDRLIDGLTRHLIVADAATMHSGSEQEVALDMENSTTNPTDFDVFLCHNSEDKPEVQKIADDLIKRGLRPWLDERELQPGKSWQDILVEQIQNIQTVAVFIGKSGFGPWQNMETRAFINEFVERERPVIPVMLPSAEDTPGLPILLKNLNYVDFRDTTTDSLKQLIWGITNEKLDDQTRKYYPPENELVNRQDEKGINRDTSKLQIFLCHAKEDKAVVRNIYQWLTSIEHRPWMDEENILPGQDWLLSIQSAIKNSNIILVCLSSSSITKSGVVQREIKLALDAATERPEEEIYIVPCRLEECDVPLALQKWQWVDYFKDHGKGRLEETLNIVRKFQFRSS